MTEAVKQLMVTLEGLTLEERADLAYHLLESLDEDDGEVAVAWDAEIDRRVAEVRNGDAEGRTAEKVFGHLRELYP